ncbi:tRNAHis guanylyltransferase [Rickenella mellea]|uniref:tRNA(His) guanylyltransferase n=1 Tax=Rickenella mellea TaxID=50990 RepID=A0A4Y7QD67_9AGAM|nr:tRNAHis guanylyltransferase [Rickenella mellea]
MAGSKYAYVKAFELPDPILPNTFIILRVDGHSFHRFTDEHSFHKPNDERALALMDRAAIDLMNEHKDIVLAFGESDEFSFLLRRSTALYNRRLSKILSSLTSQFTSSYVFHWHEYFPETPLLFPPSFDGRIVLYPGEKEVRDYFAWRQVDTHINNLYNTTFWALVQTGGQTTTQAHAHLKGTQSKEKNEILFNLFGINYNNIPARFRKGSVLVRQEVNGQLDRYASDMASEGPVILPDVLGHGDHVGSTIVRDSPNAACPPTISSSSTTAYPSHNNGGIPESPVRKTHKSNPRTVVRVLHVDIIRDDFWNDMPHILSE